MVLAVCICSLLSQSSRFFVLLILCSLMRCALFIGMPLHASLQHATCHTGAAWKAAFTAQAAPFQPKQAASSTQPAPENGEPTTTTSDPAPADATQQKSESPAASNSALSDTKEETKSPAAKLAQHQSPESQLKTASVSAAQNNHSPVKLAASAEEGPPQTAVSSNGRDHTAASTASSAVVEDLDVLHTEQVCITLMHCSPLAAHNKHCQVLRHY